MSTGLKDDIDRAAIADHAQRTAEKAALRKVRKALDKDQDARDDERRTFRRVLAICAILALMGVAFIMWLFMEGRGFQQPAPYKIPAAEKTS